MHLALRIRRAVAFNVIKAREEIDALVLRGRSGVPTVNRAQKPPGFGNDEDHASH